MQIFISRNNQRHGPYSLEDIESYLASGHLHANDLAWHEGGQGWIPLSQVPGVKPSQNRVPPPPAQILPTKQHMPHIPPTKKPVTKFQKAVLGIFGAMFLIGMAQTSIDSYKKEKQEAQQEEAVLVKGRNERAAARKRAAVIAANPKLAAAEREKVRRIKEEKIRKLAQAKRERKEKEEKEKKLAAESISKKKKAVEAFASLMNNEGNGQLFASYGISGNDLTIKVTDDWHTQPYQYRLQRAQAFHLIWAKACNLDDPRDAGFKITDIMGNKVGGWNIVNGLWVDK